MSTVQLFGGATTLALFGLRYAQIQPVVDYHLSSLLLLSLLATSAFAGLWHLLIYPTLFDPLRRLPAPKGGLPFFGYAFELPRRPPSSIFGEWMRTIPNDGLIRMPYFAGKSVLIPTTAQGFSQVLVTKSYDYTKQDSVRRLLAYVLGDGLVTSEHDLHRVHRKNMSVMFGHRQIKNLHPLIWEKAASMVTHIAQAMSSDPRSVHGQIVEVDVYEWASKATLDIIGIVALGHEFNSLENANDKLAQLYTWFFTPSVKRSVFFAMSVILPQAVMKVLPWRIEDEMKAKSQELHQRCEDLVIQKKSHLAKYEKDRVDVLEHMIEAGFFSNKELVDELLSMLAAGHETTSSALTWALYALARDSQLQSRLRKEVTESIDEFSGQWDLRNVEFSNTLDSLPLLHGLCNEVQRLWPSVPNTSRIAYRDTTIVGQTVPKGTKVFIPIWTINRLEQFWGDDAQQFRPERWINAENGKPNNHGGCNNNFGFMTYLHGPRSCIGQGLARAELKALVAAWLYCFEFEFADPNFEAEAAGIVTVKPKGGLKLRMKVLKSFSK